MSTRDPLSCRGQKLADNPARIDFELFMEAAGNLYHPETNPEGAFPLNVAENCLALSRIKDKLTAILQQKKMPDWVLKYTDSLGHPEVRDEVARFMSDYLCHTPIAPESIAFSAGATAVIEVSSFVLADPGDVVVIPAPSYPMYSKDLGIKSQAERYDLQTHHDIQEIGAHAPVSPQLLDQTLAELNQQGKRFRILLITSPDNPTGCRYTELQLRALADWCIRHEIHLVVNEIYGLSLIDTQDPQLRNYYPEEEAYCSFARIMADPKSDWLHLWYAFSKDFSMSGLRFGVLHTLNESLLEGYANANLPHLVSNHTQWMVAEMLKDHDFLKAFTAENQTLLTRSYKRVVQALDQLHTPYIPAHGSLFVWADLSRFLAEDSDQGQEQLWLDIFRHTGLLLTPGEGFGHKKKGLFRIVFTAVPYEHLQVAMDKMVDYLLKRGTP